MRFLVIDDSIADSRLLQAMLRQACPQSFEVEHAPSGREGLQSLQEREFDCVFLDYRLEDSRDWDVLDKIRASGNDVPIVAISGHGNEQVAVEGLKQGAQDYLVKDAMTPETVHRALTNAMEKVKLAREVDERQKEMRDFAHMAAHDIRAPLRRIHQLASFLQEDLEGKLDESSARHVQLIGANAGRLEALVKSLIDYARHGVMERPQAVVSLKKAEEAAWQNLELEVAETRAVIESGELPEVVGDETTLTLLFQNLFSNAIKFRGQSDPHVQVSAVEEGDHWKVFVTDNGIGIPQQECETIFAPFRRLNAQQTYEGSGIGLATCKRIVDHHGGKIWAESELGKGTKIVFTIPKSMEQASAGEIPDP
ncbi:ATP-binding protein [Bremerella sp. JC770]|uniref:sensor histidine kinase n=1 Tax=Bremerella sp. JC770 TaxID=3232137 RepID=UPI003459F325